MLGIQYGSYVHIGWILCYSKIQILLLPTVFNIISINVDFDKHQFSLRYFSCIMSNINRLYHIQASSNLDGNWEIITIFFLCKSCFTYRRTNKPKSKTAFMTFLCKMKKYHFSELYIMINDKLLEFFDLFSDRLSKIVESE